MRHPILTIAAFTYRDAVRSRFPGLLLVTLVSLLFCGSFVGHLTITDAAAIQAAVVAALFRGMAVFVLGVFVITSVMREIADQGMAFLFALPLSRSNYFFGKLLGFAILVVILVMSGAGLALWYAPPQAVLIWSFGLACELLLVAAFALLLAISLRHAALALAGLLGFYCLARTASSLLLLAQGPQYSADSWFDAGMLGILRLIAWLLPALEQFTNADWLIQTPAFQVSLPVLVHSVLYLALLSLMALIDLERKVL